MSFVEQEDVLNIVETLMINLFKNFSSKKMLNDKFPRITYKESMKKYGTDKPDLRNPLSFKNLQSYLKETTLNLIYLKN